MIGLILIYFIGKWHYQLATDYHKNKWLFAILGVIVYYLGVFAGGFILGIIGIVTGYEGLFELPDLLLSIIALPFGLLTTWGLYKFLEKNWSKNNFSDPEMLDDTLIDN